jgi:hypothetical protein
MAVRAGMRERSKQRHRKAAVGLLGFATPSRGVKPDVGAGAVSAERPQSGERGRVIPLRRRHPPAGNDNRPSASTDAARPDSSAVGDLGRFERGQEGHDDYRHRMIMNALALMVCVFLILAGVWLVSKLAQMRQDQDCVLSGRRGCTPVDVPVRSRW